MTSFHPSDKALRANAFFGLSLPFSLTNPWKPRDVHLSGNLVDWTDALLAIRCTPLYLPRMPNLYLPRIPKLKTEIELDQLRFRIEALEAVLIALDKNIGESLIQFLRQTQKTEGLPLHNNIEASRAIEEITAVLNVMSPHRESSLPNVTVQLPTKRQSTGTLSVIGAPSFPFA